MRVLGLVVPEVFNGVIRDNLAVLNGLDRFTATLALRSLLLFEQPSKESLLKDIVPCSRHSRLKTIVPLQKLMW